MIRIGLDVFGGDYAPEATVLGAIQAYKELPEDTKLVLFGNRDDILTITGREGFDASLFDLVHTTEQIAMHDHPAKSFAQKAEASIVLGFKHLAGGLIHGFASAGNTGAMMVGAVQVVKMVPGVIRPCITATVPRLQAKPAILLDVGINPDCKPDVLYQYAVLGSVYAQFVYGVENPRVALVNIGSEEEKGNLLTKATFQVMKGSKDFNFVGNVEGNDFFSDHADVLVCDGFVGNVMLKEAEAFYKLIRQRKIQDEFFEKFNFENYGGTPVLGVNAPVIIGHGISNPKAIKNMLLHTREVVTANLADKIKEIFK